MANEILKIEKELRDIMNTYQSELDGLEKDKTSAKRQLDKTMEVLKEKDYELASLNKDIVRKDKEIKELNRRLETQEREHRRNQEKQRKDIEDVHAELEMKNNEFKKIKVQLER